MNVPALFTEGDFVTRAVAVLLLLMSEISLAGNY